MVDPNQKPIVIGPRQARQGRLGGDVFVMLIGSLALAVVAMVLLLWWFYSGSLHN